MEMEIVLGVFPLFPLKEVRSGAHGGAHGRALALADRTGRDTRYRFGGGEDRKPLFLSEAVGSWPRWPSRPLRPFS